MNTSRNFHHRLAFSVTCEEIADRFTDLMTLANCNTASFTQIAGDEALRGDQSATESMITEFKIRSEILYGGLSKIPGITCAKSSGAFYLFPNVTKFTTDVGRTARELQSMLLHQYGVAVLPGSVFGKGGEGYTRLFCAAGRETFEKALERLSKAFRELGN